MHPKILKKNLSKVRDRIQTASRKAGREFNDIKLLAVSKTKPPQSIRTLHQFGVYAFGENYAQELAHKKSALQELNLEWHFIGPIQSNKSRLIANNCDWVHSVDRIKVAEKLSQHRSSEKQPLQVLLQVNISRETSKSGVRPDDILELAEAVMLLPRLRLRGLMTIPSPSKECITQRQAFADLRNLQETLTNKIQCMDTLSMGMSEDFEAAILEGSTIVRVGTHIFGSRYT